VPGKKQRAAIGSAMERAGVAHMAGTVIGHLSKGYRQRVALADALVSDPPLLILDEPTAGLDPNQIREVRSLIRALAGERTILLSTHILSEVEATCERAIVIDRGRLVAEGSIQALRARQHSSALSVRVRDPNAGAEAAIARVSGLILREASVDPAASSRRTLRITVNEGADPETTIEALVRALTEAGIGIHALVPEQASLEQVFSELTAHEKAAADASAVASEP
jgi:ABC-2 type transport system ATP-binding protein